MRLKAAYGEANPGLTNLALQACLLQPILTFLSVPITYYADSSKIFVVPLVTFQGAAEHLL